MSGCVSSHRPSPRGARTFVVYLPGHVSNSLYSSFVIGVLPCWLNLMPSQSLKSVSIDHASALLQKSRRTIYNRIHDGRLETIRVGVSQRVTLESLFRQPEFVQQQRLIEYLRTHTSAETPKNDGGSPS